MPTELEFFTKTQDTWEAMYRDCLRAEKSISFEQYLLLGDKVGNRFLKLFRDKAKAGVSVHLLLDAVGSWSVRSSPLLKELRNAGGKVRFYNTLRIWHLFRPSRWFPRSHCKTMLIDSEVAYTGGVCMAGFMQHWHDLHVRITGDLVTDIQAQSRRSGQVQGRNRDVTKGKFRYVAKISKLGKNPIYKALLKSINAAERDVCLVTPYFFPPRRLRKALRMAAGRGVRVRVMLSEKTDSPLASALSRSYFRGLMRHGVEIITFHENILHAKYAIVDDHWATMGSTNWDYLSLFYNREANLIIEDKKIITELRAIFENDTQMCKAADMRLPLWMRLFWAAIQRIRKVF